MTQTSRVFAALTLTSWIQGSLLLLLLLLQPSLQLAVYRTRARAPQASRLPPHSGVSLRKSEGTMHQAYPRARSRFMWNKPPLRGRGVRRLRWHLPNLYAQLLPQCGPAQHRSMPPSPHPSTMRIRLGKSVRPDALRCGAVPELSARPYDLWPHDLVVLLFNYN